MRLKGFTIFEMLMTLALTGVMVLLAGRVYLYFQEIQAKELHKMAQLRSYMYLDLSMQHDIQKAYAFRFSKERLEILDREEKPIAQYEFDEDWVIRKLPQVDTFFTRTSLLRETSDSVFLQVLIEEPELTLVYQTLPYSTAFNESTSH